MDKINLRELFTLSYDYLPELVDSKNCIYRILNLVNGKCYIGQTKWFYGRFRFNGLSHFGTYVYYNQNECNIKFYRALIKYRSKNFDVEVIEKDLPDELLNEREIYWISYYDSFNNGYNMTLGGTDCSQLKSPEVVERASFNQGTTRLFKNIENKLKYLKDNNLELNTFNYARNTNDPACITQHIPRVLSKFDIIRLDSRWTKELDDLFLDYKENGIPPIDINRYYELKRLAGYSISIGRLFKSINEKLEYLKYTNHEITPLNYIELCYKIHNIYHITNVLDQIGTLRSDNRWTDEIEEIFKYFESNGINYNLRNNKLFQSINLRIKSLKDQRLAIDSYNYSWCTGYCTNHVNNVIKYINILREDIRWTDDLDNLFKDIELNGIPNYQGWNSDFRPRQLNS